MNKGNKAVIDGNLKEIYSVLVRLKLIYYFFQRIPGNIFLKNKINKVFGVLINGLHIDRFLINEGGLFKMLTYSKCNRMMRIRGSRILIPGAGFGNNILQLCSFRPKEIIAFDLYGYPEEWKYVSDLAERYFGVKVTFIKGGFESIPSDLSGKFDLIISDAVLEHVGDMADFAVRSLNFLKTGGIFYASFGPIWYGPSGDHMDWGGGRNLYKHLLADAEDYEHSIRAKAVSVDSGDSVYDAVFMHEKKLFSYLKFPDYLDAFLSVGFKKARFWAKINTSAMKMLTRDSGLNSDLDNKMVPSFDRFCNGGNLWLIK